MAADEPVMALVVHDDGTSSRHVDEFNPTEENFVAQRSMEDVDDYLPPPPLCTVRPESLDNEQEKYPGFHYDEEAKKATRTKETGPGLAKTYTRKRGRPLGSKSSKGMVEQKAAIFDGSSGSSSDSKDDDFEPPRQTRKRRRPSRYISSKGKIDYVDSSSCSSEGRKGIEPPTPTRKRGRPARAKSSRSKIGYVDSSSSSSGQGRKYKDHDFELEVSDDDDSHTKYASVKGTAMHRAEKLMEELPPDGLRFIKYMKQSHVVRGYWLGLPSADCRGNLPDRDVAIILEDEGGLTFKTRYLAYKTGLSGGWRKFAKKHKIKVDDVLVFQQVEPRKFKVYIVKKSKVTRTDRALGLDTSMETNTSSKKGSSKKGTNSKKVPTKKRRNAPEAVTRGRGSRRPSSNEGDKLASEDAAGGGGISYGGPDQTGDFVPMENPEKFSILISDGTVVGHVVLPDRLCMVYYTLCHARKAFLHRNLSTQLRTTLVTGMIVQTASIAEGIMAASPAMEDLMSWKKALESFESMGMDVAFMSERVDKLIDLLSTPVPAMEEPEGYAELELERARLAKQLRDLESRLSNLKNAEKEMGVEMEEMNPKKKREQAVRELATAPW